MRETKYVQAIANEIKRKFTAIVIMVIAEETPLTSPIKPLLVESPEPSPKDTTSLVPMTHGGAALDIVENYFETYYQKLPPPKTSSNLDLMKQYLYGLPVIRNFMPKPDPQKQYEQELLNRHKTATSFTSWYTTLLELDDITGKNEWKRTEELDLYDNKLVRAHLEDMKNARELGNHKYLLYLIRTRWVRNLGNMGDISLYRHLFVGTKLLIEEYIEECKRSLRYLLECGSELNDNYLLGMLIQTRRNIGRTALLLSGGGTFGIFHLGVLVSLAEANLLPRIISGSLAGSIMALILCCNEMDDTMTMLRNLTQYRFDIFGEHTQTSSDDSRFKALLNVLSHLLKYGTLFDTLGLKQTMIHFVGDLTFREAYNRTGKILNISVTPGLIHEQLTLLNYLTAPNCLVWLVVCALCSAPGVFPLTTIYEKNPRTGEIQEWNNDLLSKYVDGSVDNDLPISRLSEMFNVDHIIAVQVNPHVAPVLGYSLSAVGGDVENEMLYKMKRFVNNAYDFFTLEAIHYIQVLNELDIHKNLMNKMLAILTQQYTGDITIFPDFKPQDFTRVFSNPTPEFTIDFIIRGARALWPKMTMINNHCGVEFALDNVITELRGRIVTKSLRLIKPVQSSTHKHSHSIQNLQALPKNRLFQSLLMAIKPGVQRRNTTQILGSPRVQRKKQTKDTPTQTPTATPTSTPTPKPTRPVSMVTKPSEFPSYADIDDGYEDYTDGIRKSRSLGAMLRLENRNSTGDIHGLHNPYFDRLENKFHFDSNPPVPPKQMMTLPSTSNNRNLYVGLNRLKDMGLVTPTKSRPRPHRPSILDDMGGYDFYGLMDMNRGDSNDSVNPYFGPVHDYSKAVYDDDDNEDDINDEFDESDESDEYDEANNDYDDDEDFDEDIDIPRRVLV